MSDRILSLSLADDALGVAWLIDNRSPGLSGSQLAWFSRVELSRETFGYAGRTAGRTVNRQRMPLDPSMADGSDHVADIETVDLARAIARQLGEFGSALLLTGSIDQAAESAGISRATAYRRIADVRSMFAGFDQ